MTIAVRRSGFTIPLSLVVLTSTAMLLAGCQSGGASNANQQGTAGSSSSSPANSANSAKSQSVAGSKPTSGQKSGHASPRIPSPTGKGAGESSGPQPSSGSAARPSSPRANEPRPATSGAQSSANGAGASRAATPGGTSNPSTQNEGASKNPEASGNASRSSEPQAETAQSAQSSAPEPQASPAPAQPTQAPADNSGGNTDTASPAPAPTEPAPPADSQAGQATSFVPDNLVSEKTAMVISPSGNIGCDLSAHYAGCGVFSYRTESTFGQNAMGSPNWWFDLSSGATPQISGRSEGAFSLDEGFRGAGSSPQVVEYGQSVTFGSWVCSSEETGMTCRNTETGHGVFLNSSRYEVF
ncbi:hypothetical protein FK256_08050 [Actinomyces johnsonii]|uniref:Uncharacterized protein n=1 Tax=Actinomyces johnsonii TaxID=544581 RepID=A0A508AB07_9ACTO|nr:hypothetical protein [Actinomyces johnsonii]KAA8736140.1 hypothetical protein F4W10_12970 [Actinomyces johnsonii]TQD42982.1 hypothetical protein FK256_08050 [Actinomyces johnsonii]